MEVPEKCCWKNEAFWFIASYALVATLILCGFIWDRAGREYPHPTVHVIVHYQPVETTHLAQWVGEVAVEAVRHGKRSEPGKLSPETIRAIELQTAKDFFSGHVRDPFQAR